jgi:L-Ala-D/L-Glu epimerase
MIAPECFPPLSLSLAIETFPIKGVFRIAREARTCVDVVVATLTDPEGRHGRGECRPYARYGETPQGVSATLEALTPWLAGGGADRTRLQTLLPAGAARNALDCALWDLEAKRRGLPAWHLAGFDRPPAPCITAYTLSIDAPETMAAAASAAHDRPLLKIKLAGDGLDLQRMAAIRRAAPAARLIVDANEGWQADDLPALASAFASLGVEMIEQPLPAAADAPLAHIGSPLPLAADESAHGLARLDHLAELYQIINIKLDKTGGLTEALALRHAARQRGLRIMVGCMVASSLAMAPAMLLTPDADYVDLDGPLLLATDRPHPLLYEGATIHPPSAALWG